MRLQGSRVGIVGAGIGGLTAANALISRGAEVVVFERARRNHQGIALLLWANAMKALASLELTEALLARASPIEITDVRTATGELLCSLPIGTWSRRVEMPSVAVRRSELVEVLAARLGEGVVREAMAFHSFHPSGDGLRVRFEDGREEHVDALIGADGLRSTVRAFLFGDQQPRELRQRAWVGTAPPGPVPPGVATASVGHGPRFWTAPLRDGVFWYATLNDVSANERPARAVLLDAFAGWHHPIRELLERSSDDDIVTTQVRDRLPSERWGEGAVTLLGDAAHASTPDLGQGACQAIESAIVLADCLARAESLPAGLRAYEQARQRRTATISRLCWMTSVNSTIESPVLCRIRDAAMRVGLKNVARGHLEWILAGPAC